ncbi:hypothetical protein YC2023_048790 [Brassica napus]|nr:unnamed protein product [Brassica napus]
MHTNYSKTTSVCFMIVQRTVRDYMFLDTLDSYRKEMAEKKKQQPKKGSRGKGLKKDGTAFDSLNDETPTSEKYAGVQYSKTSYNEGEPLHICNITDKRKR